VDRTRLADSTIAGTYICRGRAAIACARACVADVHGEELDEALRGAVPGARDGVGLFLVQTLTLGESSSGAAFAARDIPQSLYPWALSVTGFACRQAASSARVNRTVSLTGTTVCRYMEFGSAIDKA
jgi:hypothetical protein